MIMQSTNTVRTTAPIRMREDAADDAALLAQVRRGDEAACEEFVLRHGGRILATARRFLRCQEDVADAVQETFVSAFRSIREFAGGSKVSTWLHRIAVNVCLMKLRSAKCRPARSSANLVSLDDAGRHARRVPERDVSPLERMHTTELRARVRECIDELPETYRVVLLLRDIEELDTRQTAERLSISQAAVKVRLHRARQALRTLLEPLFAADGTCRQAAGGKLSHRSGIGTNDRFRHGRGLGAYERLRPACYFGDVIGDSAEEPLAGADHETRHTRTAP
jgi:RNA polymerase sigma-70 factor (ECF subfamily)